MIPKLLQTYPLPCVVCFCVFLLFVLFQDILFFVLATLVCVYGRVFSKRGCDPYDIKVLKFLIGWQAAHHHLIAE